MEEPLRSVRSRNHTIAVVDLLGYYLGFVNGGSSLCRKAGRQRAL